MTPCIYCKVEIDSDIWQEELGLCLDCSHAYFNHQIDLIGVQCLIYVLGVRGMLWTTSLVSTVKTFVQIVQESLKMSDAAKVDEVFSGLWDLFYTLESIRDKRKFEEAVAILVELFPEEKFND